MECPNLTTYVRVGGRSSMPGLRFSYIAPISMYVLREYRPMSVRHGDGQSASVKDGGE